MAADWQSTQRSAIPIRTRLGEFVGHADRWLGFFDFKPDAFERLEKQENLCR